MSPDCDMHDMLLIWDIGSINLGLCGRHILLCRRLQFFQLLH